MQQLQIVYPAVIAVLACGLVGLVYVLTRVQRDLTEEKRQRSFETAASAHRISELERRLRPLSSLDDEVTRLNSATAAALQAIEILRSSYTEKKEVYDRLLHEIAISDERLSFAEMGIYEPHFEFADSEEYKRAIEKVRDDQKWHVKAKSAVICTTTWQVDGSSSKGQTMTNRAIRLTLRAFNNECDVAIANARWNNVNAMEKRVRNAQAQIDKLNESTAVTITDDYVYLKTKELFLTHEHREKQKAEREERAEAARSAREEQKLVRDMERAEEEEDRYRRLLAKAKDEADRITGPQLDAFNQQIQILERDLAEARSKVERAQAMAELTRSGYIYIISNIGSFGEDVVKIGLTRRLDPVDRIRELGDASVPFTFDTHAIIYSDDAPSLERSLHAEFDAVRINAMNFRKEFFRAKIDDVEEAVKRLAPTAPFFKDIEAQDYRETLAKRNALLHAPESVQQPAFPDRI